MNNNQVTNTRNIGQVQSELCKEAKKNIFSEKYYELVLELAIIQNNLPIIEKAKTKLQNIKCDLVK